MATFSVSFYGLTFNPHQASDQAQVARYPILIDINNKQRLVRFLAKDGRTHYGDAILPAGETDISKATQAKIITGPIFGNHEVTDEIADIKHLLAPLALEDVKTVRCLGLNYEKHAIEVCAQFPASQNFKFYKLTECKIVQHATPEIPRPLLQTPNLPHWTLRSHSHPPSRPRRNLRL